ncbi:MAG: AEC family transporter [Halocynthiibacter sp.]
MQSLIEVILPVFLVIGFGYVAVLRGMFSEAGVDGLMNFTQNFAIPTLLFIAISNLDLSQSFDIRLLLSFYTGASAGFAIGLLGARYIFGRSWPDAVAIGFVGLYSNSVLLGLPITERAYGSAALAGNYMIIALHAPFCYTVGVTAMEIAQNRGKGALTALRAVVHSMSRNALVIGIILGFAVNLSGLVLPGVLTDALDLMVRAAIPAALFALGGVLVQYRPEGDLRTILFVCAVSLIIHPAVVWVTGRALGLSPEAFRSAVLTAAMAPGVNTYVFANLYNRARRVAATSVLVATVASVFTAWIWLALLGA